MKKIIEKNPYLDKNNQIVKGRDLDYYEWNKIVLIESNPYVKEGKITDFIKFSDWMDKVKKQLKADLAIMDKKVSQKIIDSSKRFSEYTNNQVDP